MKRVMITAWALCACLATIRAEVINSVIEDYNCEVEYSSLTSGTCREQTTVTILNENGVGAGHIVIHCDKFMSLEGFKGVITDADGKEVKKLSKKDLKMTEASSSLSDDSYTYYYETYAPRYPYTVHYEVAQKIKNQSIAFAGFHAYDSRDQSVKRAHYSISVPKEVGLRYKEINVSGVVKTQQTADRITATVEMTDLPAIPTEVYSPSLGSLAPRVVFAPENFSYDGFKGDMKSWNSFGKWLYGLFEGRDVLPEELKAKVHQLADGCSTNREKVKVLYRFLQENTRYVSIQLGIGGYRPMAAADVFAKGFGDCKALSFYMKALLKEVGIESNYAVISTDKANVMADFANVTEFNHAILQVPLEADTLWLECTNPTLPFGFVHDDIAGHQTLLVKPQGGEMVRVRDYDDDLKVDTIDVDVTIAADYSAQLRVRHKSMLDGYSFAEKLGKLEAKKQELALKALLKQSNVVLSDIDFRVDKSEVPSGEVIFTASQQLYGKRSGTRLFAPINLNTPGYANYTLNSRKTDISVPASGIVYRTVLHLAEGMTVESLVKPSVTECEFGKVEEKCEQSADGSTIAITQIVHINRGRYPADRNADFKTFRDVIKRLYTQNIVIKK